MKLCRSYVLLLSHHENRGRQTETNETSTPNQLSPLLKFIHFPTEFVNDESCDERKKKNEARLNFVGRCFVVSISREPFRL